MSVRATDILEKFQYQERIFANKVPGILGSRQRRMLFSLVILEVVFAILAFLHLSRPTLVAINNVTAIRPRTCKLAPASEAWSLEKFRPYSAYSHGQHPFFRDGVDKSRDDIIVRFDGIPVDRTDCNLQYTVNSLLTWLTIPELYLTIFLLHGLGQPERARDILPEQHSYVAAMVVFSGTPLNHTVTVGTVACQPSLTFRLCISTGAHIPDGVDLAPMLRETLRVAYDC